VDIIYTDGKKILRVERWDNILKIEGGFMIYRFILVGILVLFSVDTLAVLCPYCGKEYDQQCSVCENEKKEFKNLVEEEALKVKSLQIAIIKVILAKCKGLTKEEVYSTIAKLANEFPVPLYWLDEKNYILGANKADLEVVGSKEVGVGKTLYEILPYNEADVMVKDNNLVMKMKYGEISCQQEEFENFTTKKIMRFAEFKASLYDKTNKPIGIIGTAVELPLK